MLASALDDTVVCHCLASSKSFDVWFTALNGVDLQEASTHEWRGKGWHEGDACTGRTSSVKLHAYSTCQLRSTSTDLAISTAWTDRMTMTCTTYVH